MDEQEFGLVYPTFIVVPERGIFPRIFLPDDYQKRVPAFYQQGRKEQIEEYVKDITKLFALKSELGLAPKVDLQWEEKRGLTNISVGIHGGLDLIEDGFPQFQEHNLGGDNSIIAGAIAMQYVSELLNSI